MTSPGGKAALRLRSPRAAEIVREMLADAGITVGGSAPWDIQVHDERLYQRVLRDGTLGFGEAYIDGWWDCAALDQMIDACCRARLASTSSDNWVLVAHAVKARLLNLQT